MKKHIILKKYKLFNFFSKQNIWLKLVSFWIIFSGLFASCDSDPYGEKWVGADVVTICQFLQANKTEYSKSYELLVKGKMLSPLCGYNPFGEDYTLFLPTNEAVDKFIQRSDVYNSFEELLLDTTFVYTLTRYHTLKRKLHTDRFPDGALLDSTFTGDRLAIAFSADGENQVIKVNNHVPIVKANVEMSNGYVHVISEVLEPAKVTGYDWIQQQDGYSILAQAMEAARIKNNIWWKKYTILAEHDSIYNRNGIYNIQDLANRIATPGLTLSNRSNAFYKFVGYHFVGGEYYINDFNWGNHKYATMASRPLTVEVGYAVKVNPGVDVFGTIVSASGDTIIVDYVGVFENSWNIMTNTGPVHSIKDILFFEPLPD